MAPLRVSGSVRVPGDKSISHRALMFGALATGRSRVRGLLLSADVRATAGALNALGWRLGPLGPEMVIDGGGLRPPVSPGIALLDCQNSGTTARLMSGIAASRPGLAEFDGDASLRTRPMRRVSEPLEAMGATFEWRSNAGRLPMGIRGGHLRSITWEIGMASAQVKSAILLAGLCGDVPVRVIEPIATRDHTERFLRAAGVSVECSDRQVSLEPAESISPLDLDVPGDPSSAAFFACLAAAASEGSLALERVLLNPLRTGFIAVLRRMGARIDVLDAAESSGEPIGTLLVSAAGLRGTDIRPDEVPSLIDEIPVLCAIASLAEGETSVSGAAELRVKESDRIATMVANLRACGVDAEERPDGLIIRGPARIRDASIVTHRDHRIAMAFGVLAALTGRDLRIDDRACVDVSYPSFWSDLARVTR